MNNQYPLPSFYDILVFLLFSLSESKLLSPRFVDLTIYSRMVRSGEKTLVQDAYCGWRDKTIPYQILHAKIECSRPESASALGVWALH